MLAELGAIGEEERFDQPIDDHPRGQEREILVAPHALAEGLLIELCWVVVLLIATRVAYGRGVRRYSAFGG